MVHDGFLADVPFPRATRYFCHFGPPKLLLASKGAASRMLVAENEVLKDIRDPSLRCDVKVKTVMIRNAFQSYTETDLSGYTFTPITFDVTGWLGLS